MRALALALCIASCSGHRGAPSTGPRPSEREAAMLGHAVDLRLVQAALLRGDLGVVHAHAAAIRESLGDPALARWPAWTARTATFADELAATPDVPAGAHAFAALASACGACHRAAGATTLTAPPRLPGTGADVVSRQMARHAWASDRLLDGIVGDSNDAWRAGLSVLSQEGAMWADDERQTLDDALRRVTLVALRDVDARPADARSIARYGEILERCAACHATVVQRVAPVPAR